MTTSRTKTTQRINRSLAEGLSFLGRHWTCFRGGQSQCGALLQYRHCMVSLLFWKGSSVLDISGIHQRCIILYLQSFQWPLPWSECPKVHFLNNMTFTENPECLASSPTQYFWYRETLNVAETIETATDFNWTIAVSLLLAWLLVYLCIIKGITENPIVIYITAIYPYVVLVIFFFRAVTLPGMGDGVIYLFTPKVSWQSCRSVTLKQAVLCRASPSPSVLSYVIRIFDNGFF